MSKIQGVPPQDGLMWMLDPFGRPQPVRLYHNSHDGWEIHQIGNDEPMYFTDATAKGYRLIGTLDLPVIK